MEHCKKRTTKLHYCTDYIAQNSDLSASYYLQLRGALPSIIPVPVIGGCPPKNIIAIKNIYDFLIVLVSCPRIDVVGVCHIYAGTGKEPSLDCG